MATFIRLILPGSLTLIPPPTTPACINLPAPKVQKRLLLCIQMEKKRYSNAYRVQPRRHIRSRLHSIPVQPVFASANSPDKSVEFLSPQNRQKRLSPYFMSCEETVQLT